MANGSERGGGQSHTVRSKAHIVVAVGDLDRSVRFYEKLTGTPAAFSGRVDRPGLARAMGLDKISFDYAAIEFVSFRLVLRQFTVPVPWRGAIDIVDNGSVHVCLEVGDLARALVRIHEAGTTANGPPAPAPEAHQHSQTHHVLYLEGPDGEHVELVGPLEPSRSLASPS